MRLDSEAEIAKAAVCQCIEWSARYTKYYEWCDYEASRFDVERDRYAWLV